MISSSSNISSRSKGDFLLSWSVRLLALMAGGLLLLVVSFLLRESWPGLQHIGLARFFSNPDWYPTEDSYRLTSIIWITVWATVGSVLLAAPLGILSALFCHFYAPRLLSRWYRPWSNSWPVFLQSSSASGLSCPWSHLSRVGILRRKSADRYSHPNAYDPSYHHVGCPREHCPSSCRLYSKLRSLRIQSIVVDLAHHFFPQPRLDCSRVFCWDRPEPLAKPWPS